MGIRNKQRVKLDKWCHATNLIVGSKISAFIKKEMDNDKSKGWKQKPDRLHNDE